MSGSLEFGMTFPDPGRIPARRIEPDAPFRILMLGDFSGRADREGLAAGASALAGRRPLRLEPADLDATLRRLRPAVDAGGASGAPHRVEVASLEDFRPESLLRRYRWLSASAPPPEETPPAPPPPKAKGESDAQALERLFGKPPAARRSAAEEAVERLVEDAVRPHVVRETGRGVAGPGFDPEALRALLADPAFSRLEGAWRGLARLLSAAEGDASVEYTLFDASPGEIADDLATTAGDIARSALARALAPAGEGASRPSVLVVDFAFGRTAEDLFVLTALGVLATHLGCAILAEADAAIAEASPAPEVEGAFRALRESPVAPRIALALPRTLARLPYGKRADPVARTSFEEGSAVVWSSPAYAVAEVLARTFVAEGWMMEPPAGADVEDLPAWTEGSGDEARLHPVAETVLSDRAAESLLDRGLVPVVAHANRAAARLPRIQSVSDPPAPLRGPWGRT